MVGLLRPTSGTVKVAGYDIQTQPLQAKAVSGYVPDTPNLYPKLSGRELLHFVGELYNIEGEQINRRIEELLKLFNLDHAGDDTIDSYSHGMQQKTALSCALMHDPKVLVLDEPTVGLDPKSARMIKDMLRQMANHHRDHAGTESGKGALSGHRDEPWLFQPLHLRFRRWHRPRCRVPQPAWISDAIIRLPQLGQFRCWPQSLLLRAGDRCHQFDERHSIHP